MATYILVHGGGHGGWCWDRVAPLLTTAGHRVFAPTLTGVGERLHEVTPDTGLNTHIADITDLIRAGDLRDVILVGHSYGGMVITGAADRVINRIAELVYLDAAIPVDGEALVDTSPGMRDFGQRSLRTVDGVDLTLWPDSFPLAIFGLVRAEDLAFAEGRLTPHPWKSFIEPLRFTQPDRVAALPRTIINCPSTLAMRSPETIERWQDADRVWEIDTGHDVMISKPQALAEMLLKRA